MKCRVNKTLKDIIGTGNDYIKKIKEFEHQIVETIQRGKKTIGIQRGIKLFGISPSTYRIWAMESYFRCGQSLTKLCSGPIFKRVTKYLSLTIDLEVSYKKPKVL